MKSHYSDCKQTTWLLLRPKKVSLSDIYANWIAIAIANSLRFEINNVRYFRFNYRNENLVICFMLSWWRWGFCDICAMSRFPCKTFDSIFMVQVNAPSLSSQSIFYVSETAKCTPEIQLKKIKFLKSFSISWIFWRRTHHGEIKASANLSSQTLFQLKRLAGGHDIALYYPFFMLPISSSSFPVLIWACHLMLLIFYWMD